MIYFFDNELNMVKVATSKNVISAVHEHELNGLILGTVETDLSYTEAFINDVDYFGYYYKDNYYLHKIKRVEHEHENELVRITGRHIFFEDMLYGDYIRDVRPVNRDALYILNQTISSNTRWQTVMTDTSKLHSETYYWVPPMEVLNDLTENVGIEYEPKILFDGQKINGFQLHVANRIGEDTPIRVPFGSRVLNLKYEVDYSEIVTALYGHGKGEEVGDGYGRRINFSSVNFSRNDVVSRPGSLFMENPEITAQYGKDDGSPKFGRIIFEDIESASELANATYEAYLEQSRPKMLFEASVVDLGDVGMGDGVLIIRREYDVYFNARIHKLMVDLLDAENADVELGDYAHFKESKVQRKTRESNNQYRRETSSRIQQLKGQFNDRFDGEVNQMREDFEQALINTHAEIEAAEQRHEDRWQAIDDEINHNIEKIVGGNVDILDTNLLDINQRMLSKLEESDLEPFENRLTVNEEGVDGLLTRTSEAEQSIADINLSVDGITADFANYKRDVDSDVRAISAQVASYEASVDGFRAEVGTLEDGVVQEFAAIDQRFDNITSTVQNLNLNTRNMLMGSDFENPNLIRTYTNVDIISRDVGMVVRLGRPGGNEGINTATFMFEESITLEKDKDYYFVIDYRTFSTPELDYMTINTDDGDWIALYDHETDQEGLVNLIVDGTWRKGVMHIRPTSTLAGTLRVGTRFNRGVEGVWIEVKRPYLTNTLNREWVPHPSDGQNVDELVDRITQVEQTSESIRAHVQEISNDALMQSDFVLQSEGFFLGGKYVGGDHYSTAIVGSRDGIDILASRMRVTGDLLVRGDVESYALSAVHGDITNLRSKLLTANVVQSGHLRVNSALANKFNANSAFIDRLEVKAANIRDLDVIDIHANTFSSTVPGSNREITMEDGRARFRYGSVTIETTSGRQVIIDGYLNRSSSMISRTPSFMASTVSVEGSWFRINQRTYTTAHMEHYVHEARYLRANIALNRWGYDGEIADARIIAGGKTSAFVSTHGKGNGSHYDWITVDLGEPLDRPIMGTAEYQFSNRHRLGEVAMHLGNRFLTDNY